MYAISRGRLASRTIPCQTVLSPSNCSRNINCLPGRGVSRVFTASRESSANQAKRAVHPIRTVRRSLEIVTVLLMAQACISCSGNSTSQAEKQAPPAQPAAPAVPSDIQTAAESDLGSEAEVLAFGDLAKNGRTQALVVNRLKTTPQGTVPGTLVSRAAIIEREDGQWKEIFRCDEHLKNTKGYLGGTPLAGVPSWRLQSEQKEDKGLQMYFTPLARPAGGYVQTLEVRWNPEVKRYQSLDRNFEHFLTELPAIETPQSQGHL